MSSQKNNIKMQNNYIKQTGDKAFLYFTHGCFSATYVMRFCINKK